MSDVSEKVKKIIVDQLGVSAEEVKPEASFVEDLGADSLDLTELIMASNSTGAPTPEGLPAFRPAACRRALPHGRAVPTRRKNGAAAQTPNETALLPRP